MTPKKPRPTPRQNRPTPRPVDAVELDFQDILDSMARQVAAQAKEIALLEARLAAANRHTHLAPETPSEVP